MKIHHAFGLILLLAMFFGPGKVGAQTNIDWTKYTNAIPANSDSNSTGGRIPLGTAGKGDSNHVYGASVLKDGPTDYKMWYTGHDGTKYRIYYATSPNGLDWTKYDNTTPANSDSNSTGGRIPLGSNGKGDDGGTFRPTVFKDGSTYKMWYTGYDEGNYRIYYATSSNGLDWIKYNNITPADSDTASTGGRIPLGSNGKGDDGGTLYSSVLKDGSTYMMWYSGYDGSIYRIYYATSSNGLDWIKYSNAVPPGTSDTTNWGSGRIPLGGNGKGDAAHVYSPSVIRDGATYKMWYTADDALTTGRVYHATSPDGLTWTKFNNTIPPDSDTTNSNSRVGLGTAGKGDNMDLGFQNVVFFENGANGGRYYKMWYSASDGANWRIYHATFQITPPAGTIFTFH